MNFEEELRYQLLLARTKADYYRTQADKYIKLCSQAEKDYAAANRDVEHLEAALVKLEAVSNFHQNAMAAPE